VSFECGGMGGVPGRDPCHALQAEAFHQIASIEHFDPQRWPYGLQ